MGFLPAKQRKGTEFIKKILAVLLSAALALSFSACSDNSEVDCPRNSGSGKNKSSHSENLNDPGNSGGTESELPAVLEPEPVKEPNIWDEVLSKIPVTDASEFEYKYYSELGGVEITNYTGDSPNARIPDTINPLSLTSKPDNIKSPRQCFRLLFS